MYWFRVWLVFAALALAAGCATVTPSFNPYAGVPEFAPTEPPTVQVLASEPMVPHERLGEVILQIAGGPSGRRITEALKSEAAKYGAQAVFLVARRNVVMPYVYVDPYWGPTVSSVERGTVIGVAIRYVR